MTLRGIWWRAWSPLVARGATALCMAGVALGDIKLRFVWQAWRLLTSTFVLRGRRCTYDTGLALVATHTCQKRLKGLNSLALFGHQTGF